MAKRRRRVIGFIPWFGHGVRALGRWVIGHPQLFVLLSVMAVGSWGLWHYAQHAEIFRITQISLPANAPLTIQEPLIGTSLWNLDTQALSQELQHQQPWLKEVRVIRELPSTVRVETIARVPIAQVRLGGWYLVDADGFILPQASAEPVHELVRLAGVARGRGLSVGNNNTDESMLLALRVFQSLRRGPAPLWHRVTDIDVTDPQQIRFILDGETEVRCGSEVELSGNLQRLSSTLQAIAKRQLTVRYIDVRFPEPVVGPRT